jgi:hypothetical protein
LLESAEELAASKAIKASVESALETFVKVIDELS